MTTGQESDVLDTILHQPIRTRIVAFLVSREQATFTELKKELDITDGNLDAHMKKLLQAKYIRATKKAGDGKRVLTLYSLTSKGRSAFEQYLATLERILGMQF